MVSFKRIEERTLDMIVGLGLLLVALIFLVLGGVAFLPIVGVCVAVALIYFAYRIIRGGEKRSN